MYSTCLHCHRDLGRNTSIEAFPVGRRLAFDAAKGRLWVVCQVCGRWNLSPIEERWEAVESCERLFRGQRLRVQTDNIGLAKLPEGIHLIRIGRPMRPEFAAWRYGDVFRRRLVRATLLGTGAAAAVAAAGGAVAGAGAGASLVAAPLFIGPFVSLGMAGLLVRNNIRSVDVLGTNGRVLRVSSAHLDHTTFGTDDDGSLRLSLRHSYWREELTGERARRALATLLVHANRSGARRRTISAAAEFIADAGDPSHAIALVSRESKRLGAQAAVQAKMQAHYKWWKQRAALPNPGALHRLPPVHRLALEMALHESAEQRALDEELESLTQAWREAEEIAAIADDLFVPRSVTDKIDTAKRRS